MKGARGRAKDGTRMCVNMIKVYYIDKWKYNETHYFEQLIKANKNTPPQKRMMNAKATSQGLTDSAPYSLKILTILENVLVNCLVDDCNHVSF
jgi:hypothetical protein